MFYYLFCKKKKENFYFIVSNPNQDGNSISHFNVEFAPESETALKPINFNIDFDNVIYYFEHWLNIIIEYNNITFSDDEYLAKIYEQEFYDDFEILDENAAIIPFEHDKQVFLYNLLEYVEKELQKQNNDDSDIQQLVKETITLQNDLQKLSKNLVIRALAQIFSKIKMKGLNLFIDIIDVSKKELIKKVLYGSIDELSNFNGFLQ